MSIKETLINDLGVVDLEGPGFVDGYEDEKGDFEPDPRETRTRRPSHPGAILRELYLPRVAAQGVNISNLAERLGVSRRTLSMIVNESRDVSPDMANRLARAFGTSPRFWLNLQSHYDLFEAQQHAEEYESIEPLTLAA